MTKGVNIIVGDITVNNQSSESGSYGQSSLASGVYKTIESYPNDMDDVVKMGSFPVGSGKTAVTILHDSDYGGVGTSKISKTTIDAAKDWNDKPVTNLKELTIGNTTDEDGFLKIYGKNINTILVGDATHEGGDIKVYRDGSNNLQLSLDADAASNAIALSVYGGVVAQNFLTVGQTALETGYVFYAIGASKFQNTLYVADSVSIANGGIFNFINNQDVLPFNINVITPNATNHAIKLQIATNDIIVAQATGDGAGGITQTSKLVELHACLTSWIGTTGGFNIRIAEATGTATAANTFDIEVDIPSGARILGCQLRVDTALTSSNSGVSWAAAYIDGSTSAITTGQSFDQNTKTNTMYNANGANDIASAETDIRITCDTAKLFVAGGQVKAIVYYQDFTAMADA